MVLWIPTGEVDEGAEEELVIDGPLIKWCIGGVAVATFISDGPVQSALFTTMKGRRVGVACAGQSVKVFDLDGQSDSVTLPFCPEIVRSCRKGVLFVHEAKVYLMTDPLKLLGLIVPSTTTKLDAADRLVYGGSNDVDLAVFAGKNELKIVRISYFDGPRQRSSRTVSSLSTRRASTVLANPNGKRRVTSFAAAEPLNEEFTAVDLPVVEDAFASIQKEGIFMTLETIKVVANCEKLSVIGQKFANTESLYVWNTSERTLHVSLYDEDDRLIISQSTHVNGIVEVDGFIVGRTRLPFVLVLTEDFDLEISSLFFSTLQPIFAAVDGSWGPISSIKRSSGNSILLQDGLGNQKRLTLVTDITDSLVARCFNLLGSFLTPNRLVQWLTLYYALVVELPEATSWGCFEAATVACTVELSQDDTALDSIYREGSLRAQTVMKGILQPQEISPVILVFHLLREECLLNAHGESAAQKLADLLSLLTTCVEWHTWTPYYGFANDRISSRMPCVPVLDEAPNITQTLVSTLVPPKVDYPTIPNSESLFPLSNICLKVFLSLENPEFETLQLIELIDSLDLTEQLVSMLTAALRLPLLEVLAFVQMASLDHGRLTDVHRVGRKDLSLLQQGTSVALMGLTKSKGSWAPKDMRTLAKELELSDSLVQPDSSEVTRLTVTRLIFHQDRRFYEAVRLLQVSRPQQVSLQQPIDISEHEWLDMQSLLSRTVARKTMSHSFGLGALSFSSKYPLVSDQITVPALDYDIILRETNTNIVFDSSRVEPSSLAAADFYHGVCVGLSVAQDAPNISGNWILLNASQNKTDKFSHPGFLLGLGLNGHLKNLKEWYIYWYLGLKEVPVSIALLIGLCASEIGTASPKLTKVLSVHISALLPPGSADLQVKYEVQSAAILSLGLLYAKSQNRRMTEVLLNELLTPSASKTRLYRQMCGLGLGLINLGKGPDLRGMVDIHVVENLEAVSIRDDIASVPSALSATPGAIMALTLMFARSNNGAVATKLKAPGSSTLASYFRPHILFLRSLAFHMIMWDTIGKSQKWAEESVPRGLYLEPAKTNSLTSDQLPYWNVIGGVLLAMCLRHVGSADVEVLATVLHFIDELKQLLSRMPTTTNDSADRDAKITSINLTQIMSSLILGASYVTAGSGNIALLRRLRMLIDPTQKTGISSDFVAVSQAMGILFLGGGQYSFKNDAFSVGCLAISAMPLTFADGDHKLWQLMRYFWVFAAEQRCLVIREVHSGDPVQCTVRITPNSGEAYQISSPGLLPVLDTIRKIELDDARFAKITLNFDNRSIFLNNFLKTKTLFVQDREWNTEAERGPQDAFLPSSDCSHARLEDGSVRAALRSLRSLLDLPLRHDHLWGLRFFFCFVDAWMPDKLHTLARRDIEGLRVKAWKLHKPETA